MVVTMPADVILRIVQPQVSATNRFVPPTATPYGKVNEALLPVPFAMPDAPAVPAKVETLPPGVILRIV
jgi:hypothetical protein